MAITDKELLKAGFKPKKAEVHKRLIMQVEGHEKTGKTHFALTAPGPIAYFGLDIGDEGVIEKFLTAGKEIITPDDSIRVPNIIIMDPDGPKMDAVAAWEGMKRAFVACCKSPQVRSIVWDTATEVWELIRLARFGKLSQVMPVQYAPVNAEMRGLIRTAYDSNKNFVLLHKMKAEYVNDKRTGKYERAGFNDAEYIVQVNLRTFHDDETNEFGIEVLNARQNMQLCGQQFLGELCSFPMIATMVMTSTGPADWE
jgi:hypothetical protein